MRPSAWRKENVNNMVKLLTITFLSIGLAIAAEKAPAPKAPEPSVPTLSAEDARAILVAQRQVYRMQLMLNQTSQQYETVKDAVIKKYECPGCSFNEDTLTFSPPVPLRTPKAEEKK